MGTIVVLNKLSSHLRYLFTLDLPEYWENKHADQTLEVLMSDLDPAIMDQFYMKDGVSASDVTHVRPDPGAAGLSELTQGGCWTCFGLLMSILYQIPGCSRFNVGKAV